MPGSRCSKSVSWSTCSVPPFLPPVSDSVVGLWYPPVLMTAAVDAATARWSSSCSSRTRRPPIRARPRSSCRCDRPNRTSFKTPPVLLSMTRPHRAFLGFRASLSPSPSRLNASTVSSSAAPGKTMYHHAVLKIGVAVGDHLAPAGRRRADADAEEGEGRLEQDVERDLQARVDDDRRRQVGQDLAEHDPQRPTRPSAREASTNSRSRSDSTSPRTIRAM